LRLTIGIEDEEKLKKYENLFLKVNDELKKSMQDPLFLKLIQQNEGFYYEQFKAVAARREVLNSVSSGKDDLMTFLQSVDKAIVQPTEKKLEKTGILQSIANFVKEHPVLAGIGIAGLGALSFALLRRNVRVAT
jgi:hypothetical protein